MTAGTRLASLVVRLLLTPMPLLLAIEPDPQQAACLTALVSAHLTADLVLAASVAEARTALRQRRPDLVLTSSSVSAAEQAELTASLGALGDQHPGVPTLTMPHLAGHTTPPRRTRGLLSRLRRARSTPGCDPAAFAAHITECLALADAVRRAYAHATTAETADGAARPGSGEAHAGMTLQVIVEPERADEPVVAAEWLDLEPYLDDDARPAGLAGAREADGVPDANVIELPPAGELWAQLAPGYAARMAPLEGPSMTPGAPDVTSRDEDTGMEAADTVSPPMRLVRGRLRSDRPMRDEWGLYDPEQCGFAALLVRLEELADDDRREREHGERSAIMRR